MRGLLFISFNQPVFPIRKPTQLHTRYQPNSVQVMCYSLVIRYCLSTGNLWFNITKAPSGAALCALTVTSRASGFPLQVPGKEGCRGVFCPSSLLHRCCHSAGCMGPSPPAGMRGWEAGGAGDIGAGLWGGVTFLFPALAPTQ